MQPPTKWITLTAAAKYVVATTGVEVSRQTVHNWTKVGKRGAILQTERRVGTPYTTQEWVRDFLLRIA